VPTRELAMQVAEAVHKYGKAMGVVAVPIYGGSPMETQLRQLKRGVDVVVATPGRALDHIRRKSLRLAEYQGRHPGRSRRDARHGLRRGPRGHPQRDAGHATDGALLRHPSPAHRRDREPTPQESGARAHRSRGGARGFGARACVRSAYVVGRAHKMATLGRVLDVENPTSAIVFCRTRTEVDELTESLNGRGYRAEALHGGLSQDQRDRVMKKFRANTADLLIATDVAARGLDVEHVSHVVNYDVPTSAEAYVHRIGRTGRAGRDGVAITLAEPREHRLLRNIEFLTKQKIQIAAVPTVADLRARRIEMTKASLRETIVAGELDHFRAVVDSLAQEFDIMDVAAAAVKMADPGRRRGEEIPSVTIRPDRPEREPSRAKKFPRQEWAQHGAGAGGPRG
jgi:ATP-dependent RNA helicase DeaD